jgi:hypothetical protein
MKNEFQYREMKTLVSLINEQYIKGFREDFKVNDEGLKALKKGKVYQPAEIRIVNFYRFEGPSDPADECILYIIETNDGVKGTLVDAFGPLSDTKVTTFMEKVDRITKKVNPE